MKVAITAQGNTLDAQIDPRFGRAKFFIVADTETKEFKAVDNVQNFNAAQGAGIQAGQNIAGLGVESVITGHVGPKAFSVLQAAGVKIYIGAKGTVEDAIKQFKSGNLQCVDSPDVEGHWI
jgi:predicted Fe-Mo cluster-binding NifX family protein